MKFTLSWLKDHLETSAPLEEITRTLTAIGLEVEQVEDRAARLKPFTIAHVLETRPHPNADKLKICKVDTGSGINEIVCGAPNARAGIKAVLAREGVTIPASGMVLGKAKIRGVESNGMLCSERELELGADHGGIIELPEDAPVGGSFVEFMGLDDPVIEIAITPNRGDAASVRGIARDLAAAGLGTLIPLHSPLPTPQSPPSPIAVSISDPHTPMFVGRHFSGVKNGSSPAWMQQRLKAIGLRPISALVDITNYMTYDLGRPLHVFDAAKLKGNLTVRAAAEGEKLKALDGKEYTLSQGMTVIADEAGVQALGGIIGGEESGCTEVTTDVFLEVALFDPGHIARTGRALDIHSDARFRFERGVDPAFLEEACALATKLITELCGGICSAPVIAGEAPQWRRAVSFNPARVEALGGVAVPQPRMREIVETLGFGVQEGGAMWRLTPPSWRPDIAMEADVVEEVLRIYGYDHIPATALPPLEEGRSGGLSLAQKRGDVARRALAARGLSEVYGWSFVSAKEAALFGGADKALVLANPISAEMDTMRPSVLPPMLAMAARNAARQMHDAALFEVGAQYNGLEAEKQRQVAAVLRTGKTAPRNVFGTMRPVDAFDVKADALAILEAEGAPTDRLVVTDSAPGWYHPGRSGALTLGGKIVLAYFGELHPSVVKAMGVEGAAAACEVFLDALPQPKAKAGAARPPLVVSDFQPVERDFAFIIDKAVTAETVAVTFRKTEKTLLQEVSVFDIYEGSGVPEGKKSVAVSVTLQAMDRTLTDAEIEQVCRAFVNAMEKSCGAALRGGAKAA